MAERQPPAAFSPAEFELLVNGRREIDVDEVLSALDAIFQGGIDGEAPLALWLWQALREITPDERGRVLAYSSPAPTACRSTATIRRST